MARSAHTGSEPGPSLPGRDPRLAEGETILENLQRRSRRVRDIRLRFFYLVGLSAMMGYCLQAFIYGGWITGSIHAIGIACVIASISQYRRRSDNIVACWLFLIGWNFSVGITMIGEGLIESRGAWLLPLIPMAAACLLGARATFWAVVLVIGEFLAVALLDFFGHIERDIVHGPNDDFALVVLTLYLIIMFSFYVNTDSLRQLQKLSELHKRQSAAYRASARSDQQKAQFLAKMSHEIRTPMNGLLGMMRHLRTRPLPEAELQYIDTIYRCGVNLLELLRDILDLSHRETDRISIEHRPTELCALLLDLRLLFSAQAQLSNIDLVTQFSCERLWCLCDANRLRQVISNLVGNAIKFSDGGQVCIEMRVRDNADAQGADDELQIQIGVRDQGIGMTFEQQLRIFDKFQQSDDQEILQRGGTGLGLTISREIVEKMGGRIWVESKLGEGSTFWVQWVAKRASNLERSPLQLRPGAAGAGAQRSRSSSPSPSLAIRAEDSHRPVPKVLIVDDNAVNRRVVELQLKKMGCHFDRAENGEIAVQKAGQEAYDLVLMDIRMPVMDGLEATRRIRGKEGPNLHTPIVALTANAYEKDRELCLAAGMVEHIPKPFRVKDLERVLQQWVYPKQEKVLSIEGFDRPKTETKAS